MEIILWIILQTYISVCFCPNLLWNSSSVLFLLFGTSFVSFTLSVSYGL